MNQLHLHTCAKPVCDTPCQRACPYELSAYREQWRQKWRRGKVVGPLEWFEGAWMETVMGWNPWNRSMDPTLTDGAALNL